ncbi:cytochrome P450 [Micropruina sp.]|uniref:cytochrome P450 n=1 Tax=Micropruina sp. TaxID=2737536 RepID=UPI0039E3B83C
MSGPNRRRASRAGARDAPRVEHVDGVWRIRSLAVARQVLRARHATTQAGFTAEAIPKGYLRHHPILVSDGPLHDEQRSKVARFFAPKVVEERYAGIAAACADRLLGSAVAAGACCLDDLALLYTVEVTAEVVGLTHAPASRMAPRLVSFFNQPPVDVTRPDFGRTKAMWAKAAVNALVPIGRFYLADVRPAIRTRRRQRRGDVISHLLDEGYTDADILVECVTYGTAGMVTTREFIVMCAWHLLQHRPLLERYRTAGQTERFGILNELIRLEPVVGHLYRRTSEPIEVTEGDQSWTIPPGDLVDVCIRPTNADVAAVGDDPLDVCPGRPVTAGVNAAVLSFGDGAHRCPGQPLALLETDLLLTRLLALNPRIVAEPTIGWDNLIEGYQLRGMTLEFGEHGEA